MAVIIQCREGVCPSTAFAEERVGCCDGEVKCPSTAFAGERGSLRSGRLPPPPFGHLPFRAHVPQMLAHLGEDSR